jgi:hypothetical protein
MGLALASSAGLGQASTARTNTFDTADSVAGWSINYGSGTVGWASTEGMDGSGALKITLTAGGAAKLYLSNTNSPSAVSSVSMNVFRARLIYNASANVWYQIQ